MTDEKTYTRISEVLSDLAGHGIYSVQMLREDVWRELGFDYDPLTDLITHNGRTAPLYSTSPEGMQKILDNDPKGGMLNESVLTAPGAAVFDALALSAAIHYLVLPTKKVPSTLFFGRGKGYAENVRSIARAEEQGGLA